MSSVVRVCLLGAESCGKTTLCRALARSFSAPWAPEYGRAYTEIRARGQKWESAEFTHIAKVHNYIEDHLAGLAWNSRPHGPAVLFVDTDAFTTAIFHELYLGVPATGFPAEASRRYDLYILCSPAGVPFEADAIREFADNREALHTRLLAHARATGRPVLVAEGDAAARLAAACAAVESLLSKATAASVRVPADAAAPAADAAPDLAAATAGGGASAAPAIFAARGGHTH